LLACSAAEVLERYTCLLTSEEATLRTWSETEVLSGEPGKKYRRSLPTASLAVVASVKRNLVGLVGQSIEGPNRGPEVFARQSRRMRVRQVILGLGKTVLNSLFILVLEIHGVLRRTVYYA
jgi:hypothetical protein